MKDQRNKLRMFILVVTALIMVLLFIRILFDTSSSEKKGSILTNFYKLTDFFIKPFVGLIKIDNLGFTLNLDAVSAMLLIFIIGVLLSEFFSAFLYVNFGYTFKNLVSVFFRSLEFLFLVSLVFDFFYVNSSGSFYRFVSNTTDFTKNLGDYTIFEERILISKVAVLIVIIILDLLTSHFIKQMLARKKVVLIENGQAKTVYVKKDQIVN